MNPSSLIGHVLQLLEHVDAENQPADRLTNDFFRSKKYLGPRDRRFISETVFGMIRHRRLIKTLLKEFIAENPGTASLEGPHIRYMSQYAAYTIAVEKKSGIPPMMWKTHFPNIDHQRFTDWVEKNRLINFLKDDDLGRLAILHSFQDWMVKEWMEVLEKETENLLQSLNLPAPTTLRINTSRASRIECQTRLREEGIETEFTRYSPVGLIAGKRFNMQSLKSFQDGLFEMQDEGSQLISYIADPKPGDIVIDGCAGAGGKSLHMAEMMNNRGEIIAIDVIGGRLFELKSRASRAGASIIRTILQNKLQPEDFLKKTDVVLVDAPCSGTGTIRRNPGLKWSVTESLVNHYSEKQRAILEFNSHFVKPEGKLVYSTCSLLRQENEEVVAAFLREHPNFQLVPHSERFHDLNLDLGQPLMTFYPHRHATDGFFIAVMRRG